jgi:hypothetical protein
VKLDEVIVSAPIFSPKAGEKDGAPTIFSLT